MRSILETLFLAAILTIVAITGMKMFTKGVSEMLNKAVSVGVR